MEIKSAIIAARPNLSESSVKTYVSILKNLYEKLYPSDKEVDIKKFDDDEKVLEFFKNIEPTKRKTYLSALFVISKNDKYHDQMLNDIKVYSAEESSQLMSESQKKNWMTQSEIDEYINLYQRKVKKLTLQPFVMKEFQIYQDYIILCLMTGKYLAPRRLKDWTECKFHKTDDQSNYLECTSGNKKRNKTFQFVFNNYKTSKFYGAQKINCPKELYAILEPFIKLCPTEYLLCDSHKQKLSPVKLNQRLNKIFGKKVSCNILRHSYDTEKLKNVPGLDQLKDLAQSMGHSVMQSLLYAKKDAPLSEPVVEPVSEPVVQPLKADKKQEEIDLLNDLGIVSKVKKTKSTKK